MKSGLEADRLHLTHVQQSIGRIQQYTAAGRERFLADTMVQDAVLRNLQTLAESTQRLSDRAKGAEPDVPWTQIAGFRNVLAHDYLGIDLKLVWEIVEQNLPPLLEATRRMLAALGEER